MEEEIQKKEEIENKMAAEIHDKRKENIKKEIFNWLKEPLNLLLVGVLIFAFAIRFYYFFTIGNQPLWWDEAVYGSLAKNFAYHLWNQSDVILHEILTRPPLLSLLWSLLIWINLPESGVRFFLEFIPSILSVFLIYLIGKEVLIDCLILSRCKYFIGSISNVSYGVLTFNPDIKYKIIKNQ